MNPLTVLRVGIFKAKHFATWEPERAKMAAKPPIFASIWKMPLRVTNGTACFRD